MFYNDENLKNRKWHQTSLLFSSQEFLLIQLKGVWFIYHPERSKARTDNLINELFNSGPL
jgi:hypothetical protein